MPSGATSAVTNASPAPDSPVSSSNSQHGSLYDAPGDSAALSDGSHESGDGRDAGGAHPDSFVSTPARAASRIARYEAMSPSLSCGGGLDAGFIVTRTDWRDKDPADSPINRFPNEVLIHMLSYLEPAALIGVSRVSKRFYALINSSEAWRAAFVRYYPASHPPADDHGPALAANEKRYFTAIASGDPGTENLWRKEYVQRTKLLRSLAKGKVQQSGGVKSASGSLMVTYSAHIGNVNVSHMVVNFAPGHLRAVSGSVEGQFVSASNPETGKIEKRPARERTRWFTVDIPWLKTVRHDDPRHAMGIDMGINGVMDISEELGWIVGENVPDGNIYINPYSEQYPTAPLERFEIHEAGLKPAISAVWIAKKRFGGVAETVDAAIAVGNSLGYVSVLKITDQKILNEVSVIDTWCLCPGVPIVEIKVDEEFTSGKLRQNKPWIVVVNAVGEVYYLRVPPVSAKRSDWKMIQQSLRKTTFMHGRMFPAPADNGSPESEEDAYKREIKNEQALLAVDYLTLTSLFERVSMDWFIEVDFPSGMLVVGRPNSGTVQPMSSAPEPRLVRYELPEDEYIRQHTTRPGVEPWHAALLDLPRTHTLVASHTLDLSKPALAAPKTTWTPGHSARLIAFGTNASSIHIFNIREPVSYPQDHIAKLPRIAPLRSITTASPSITTLALTAAVLVHGGSDGLVQAWDPLSSTPYPIRTIHSKFSSKARRRIEQIPRLTVNNNAFAARCLALDPDPTVLRGIVALGSMIRYWSFSTSDSHSHSKRSRKRQSPTGAIMARRKLGNPASTAARIGKDVKTEQADLEAEEIAREKERRVLEKRFGVGDGGLGLDDEEMVAYAEMISREMAEREMGFMMEAGVDVGADGNTASDAPRESKTPVEEEDPDMAEAIRLSMLDQQQQYVDDFTPPPVASASSSSFAPATPAPTPFQQPSTREEDWPVFIRQKPNKQRKKKGNGKGKAAMDGGSSAGSSESWERGGWQEGPGNGVGVNGIGEDEELELAIRLSLMEAEDRA